MADDTDDSDDCPSCGTPLSERRRLTCLEFALTLHGDTDDQSGRTASVLVAAKAFEEFLLGEPTERTIQ